MSDSTMSPTAVTCLLDVFVTAQRLAAEAGVFNAASAAAGTTATGWAFEEILDALDTLVVNRYYRRVEVGDGNTVYFPTRTERR